MFGRSTVCGATTFALMLATPVAHAQTASAVQTFKDWVLYKYTGTDANICFLGARPQDTKPAGYKRGQIFFYISSWPKDGVKAEVSTSLGTPLKKGSEVSIRIRRTRYALFTKDDKAFVSDPTQEIKLIDAMKRATRMFVTATAADGTRIEDVYSLSGITAGVNRLNRGCG